MILPYLHSLKQLRIVLASNSPWRLKALEGVGLHHLEVHASRFAEDLDKTLFEDGGAYALATARHKAHDVYRSLSPEGGVDADERPVDVLIAADTVAAIPADADAQRPLAIIGKATDAEHARQILRTLSGRTHEVWTGVIMGHRSRRKGGEWVWHEFATLTKVTIAPLSESLIDAYIASDAWRGKAGAYGLQDVAGCFVERLEGDSYNVIGLPLQRVCLELAKLVESGEVS